MLSIASAAVQTQGGALAGRLRRAVESIEETLAAERHQLVLWVPVMLGVGIAAYFALPRVGQWQAVLLAAGAVAVSGLAVRGLLGRCLLWAGLLIAAGVALAWWRAESVAAPKLERSQFARTFEARVVGVDRQPALERYRLLLAPSANDLPPQVRVSLRKAPAEDILPGATVSIRATLRPPPGPSVPGGYDFARRAWFEGIGASGYSLGAPTLLKPAPPPGDARAWLDTLRRKLTERIHSQIEGAAGGIAAALVAGDRGGIPEEVTEDMRDSGLAHLLSISGLHIAVVVGGTLWLVRHLLLLSPWIALRWPVKIIAAAVAALAGIGYTLLAGAEVPTVRSCIATLLVLAGLCIGRQAISLRMVAAAALLILVVRPEALLGASFQLSFAAVTAIVVFYQSRLGKSMAGGGDIGLAARFGRAFIALLVTGLLVEGALAPIALAHFGRTGFYGVFANIIAIPFTSFVVMPAAAAALLLDPLGLGAPAYAVLGWSLDMLILLADTVASWPGAVSRLPSMPATAFAAFIVGGLWLALWEGRMRYAGFAPVALAALLALAAKPADLVVSPDGRHVAIVEDGRLVMLRPRAGSFISDMWSDAAATDSLTAWSDRTRGRCNRDACVTTVTKGGREWRLMATRSRAHLDWRQLVRACARVDIVVSERWLPDGCRPRWLKLDRAALAKSGAVAIWLDPLRVRAVADDHGDHPWATAVPDQWYRRSRPTSLP
ncbi:ComEC/Rec2 family competence protein [Sphingoaurantiacus capsulatus]|uniref:ComEC/Rec2 family competence protein n=1 Tax=Sphingoaurantiacus capsulatus TaxID=1771310 RepID=A0ABV7XCL3_9SPHN